MRIILKILLITNILFTHAVMLLIIRRSDISLMYSWLIVTVFFYVPVLVFSFAYYFFLLLRKEANLSELKYDILLIVSIVIQSTSLLLCT
jgi:hypothetical protein